MKAKNIRTFMGDFETTVYEGQEFTEVWASACVELYTEDVLIFHSLREQFDYFVSLDCNVTVYYHNLKFDGSFWLPFLMDEMKYREASLRLGDDGMDVKWVRDRAMESGSFKYTISDNGLWYTILIRVKHGNFIEIRDSLKLLPFSVAELGESFQTKHRKLDMEYTGFRYAGCPISEEEAEYIRNDVMVVKEALEIMFDEGHNKLTIGACCLSEYKRICRTSLTHPLDYNEMFPDLTQILLTSHAASNADEWIRRSYRGGWCYCVKGKEGRIYRNGVTADVNSLYPSMMSSESGNRYPIGRPYFWKGDFIPPEATGKDRYYFVRIKTRFYLREGYLPTIQMKHSYLYDQTEYLETSDILYHDENGKEIYVSHYTDRDGNLVDTRMELTLTMTDYELVKEHYELVDFEIIDGCFFYAMTGIFDEYIEKYKKQKMESKGAKRQLAKLYLNNLYGKMASSTNSSFKVAYKKDDGSLGFFLVDEEGKKAGYIAVGSAITSYSREFTIRTAQKNYHGRDRRGFIYADTDSIHCDLSVDELVGVSIHDSDFCRWKIEAFWDVAFFTRQKTYIEHVTHVDMKKADEPFYKITCAGMPDRCKNLFIQSLEGADGSGEYTPDEAGFLFDEYGNRLIRRLEDFDIGLRVPGKLVQHTIRGGVVLKEDWYTMH